METLPKTKAQKIKDIADRMQAFREGLNALVQKHNINPDAELAITPKMIQTGVILCDRVYQDRELDDKARQECYKRFTSLKNAQPAGIEHEATQEAVAALIQGEGDPLI